MSENEISNIDASQLSGLAGDFKQQLQETADNASKQKTLRVRICKGEYCFFDVYDGEDAIEKPEVIEGVILLSAKTRAYYQTEFDDRNTEDTYPDCRSRDGVIGIERDHDAQEDVGEVLCDACHVAKAAWDAEPGQQYCREMRSLTIVDIENFDRVMRLYVTPASLKVVDNYYAMLVRKGVPFTAVVTRMTLEKFETKSGFKISKLVLRPSRVLTESEFRDTQAIRGVLSGEVIDVELADSDPPASPVSPEDDIPF